jgi:hypothetical protein
VTKAKPTSHLRNVNLSHPQRTINIFVCISGWVQGVLGMDEFDLGSCEALVTAEDF